MAQLPQRPGGNRLQRSQAAGRPGGCWLHLQPHQPADSQHHRRRIQGRPAFISAGIQHRQAFTGPGQGIDHGQLGLGAAYPAIPAKGQPRVVQGCQIPVMEKRALSVGHGQFTLLCAYQDQMARAGYLGASYIANQHRISPGRQNAYLAGAKARLQQPLQLGGAVSVSPGSRKASCASSVRISSSAWRD